MAIPQSWTLRLPALAPLNDDWQPIPRWAAGAWFAFYALFLFQLSRGSGVLLMIDLVFLPIHEGGHLLFGWFGQALGVAGGTILQFFVPAALAAYFCLRRQISGTAFCLFCAFEQCLPTATYMADARIGQLDLVTVGDADFVRNDWDVMLGGMGILQHDMQIAGFVRAIGWIGMFAVVAWLVWRSLARKPQPAKPQRALS